MESIEDKLCRLVPSCVSEEGMEQLDAAIDAMAKDVPPLVEVGGKLSEESIAAETVSPLQKQSYLSVWTKVAAVLAMLALPAVFLVSQYGFDDSLTDEVLVGEDFPDGGKQRDMVVLNSTNRIDGSEDDGLIIPDDGGTPHYRYRYFVTDEEQIRDTETGTVVTVRQPRQEVVTVPVTQF